MIKKILCPTDGSEHAEKALALATDLAVRYGAELVLLHVVMANASVEDLQRFAEVEGLAKDIRREIERVRDIEHSVLAASAPALAQSISLEVLERIGRHTLNVAESEAKARGIAGIATRLESGDAGRRIVQCAEDEGVDTIVMGSRGLGNLKGLILGSVSHYVASRAGCTCITVK